MLKEHEQLKLNDYQAHLHAMQVEVLTVNQALTKHLEDKEQVIGELVVLKREESLAIADLKGAKISRSLIEKSTHTKEKDLAKREAALAVSVSAFESRKDIEMKERVSKLNSISKDILVRKQEHDIASGLLDNQLKALEIVEEDLAELLKERNHLGKSVAGIEGQQNLANETLRSLEVLIASTEQKLAETEEKVAKAVDNIQKPLQSLKDQEEELKRKIKNFDIIKARFSVQMQKYFPNQDIDNLIK